MDRTGEDHRTRVTKLLIRRAFTQLLQQKPIERITIKELSGLAGIHRSTFYAHFTDLYDLLHQLEEEMLEEFEQSIKPFLEDETRKRHPVEVSTQIFECLRENSDLCIATLGKYGDKNFAVKLIEIGRQICMESYTKYFQKATRQQIEYFYAFASAGCIGLLQKWLDDGMELPSKVVAQFAENIMLRGMEFFQEDRG